MLIQYAIIQIFGKQVFAQPNLWLSFPLSDANFTQYKQKFFFLNKVLLLKVRNKIQIGTPFLHNSRIKAFILNKITSNKLTIIKTKSKKNYVRHFGYKSYIIYINIL